MSTAYQPSDDWLDDALRNVALPAGMLGRLEQIAVRSDAQLDADLCDVVLPPVFFTSLERIAQDHSRLVESRQLPSRQVLSRPVPWERMALAASLLIAVGLSYLGAMAFFMLHTYEPRLAKRSTRLESFWPNAPLELLAGADEVAFNPTAYAEGLAAEAGFAAPDRLAPEIELAQWEQGTQLSSSAEPFIAPHAEIFPREQSWLLDTRRFAWGLFSPLRMNDENLPELHVFDGLIPRGMEPPQVPGYELVFQQMTGFHPVVVPERHAQLRTSQMPIGATPASFDLTRRLLAGGELPPREAVRTEEFLAAPDFQFPAPRQRLGLHVAGGPSPLGGPSLRLLQLGVQAAGAESGKRQPVHLTVVVDVSRSMQWGGRLEMVQAALRSLVSQLGVSDRVSLVAYSDQAEALIEDAGPEQADYLLSAIDLLRPRTWTNVGAGLQLAYSIAAEPAGSVGQSRRVVLVCDGLAGLEAGEAGRIESALSAAGKQVGLTVIDLSREPLADRQLESFAKAAGGRLARAQSAAQVRWAMIEALAGQSQTVASDVSLTVTFNPQVVAGYRLLGHEATLLTIKPEADLRAGQSAVGLYELQLKPQGDNVGTVQLAWRDPRTGQRQVVTQRITRTSFAPQFGGEAESLQLATLYAETAELLRRSPFREGLTIANLRELSGEVSSQVRENPSYRELTGMLQSAQRARPARTGTPGGWNRGGR